MEFRNRLAAVTSGEISDDSDAMMLIMDAAMKSNRRMESVPGFGPDWTEDAVTMAELQTVRLVWVKACLGEEALKDFEETALADAESAG